MARLPTVLVVNGDDFGLSRGINQGIEAAYQKGILRSASLMPNGAAFADALRIARGNPGLGIGIHVSLVGEHCVAPMERLRGLASADGILPASYGAFVKSFLLRRLGIAEIRAEIQSQITKVLAAGITPTHIDSHQHLHMLPGVFRVLIAVAHSVGIQTIRIPLEKNPQAGPGARRIQIGILSLLCRHNIKILARTGIRSADHFHGIGDSGNMNESRLLAALDRLRPGVNEVMMHPGAADPETAARYDWGYRWDDECAALIAPMVRSRIEARGIRLANFAEAWVR